MLSGITYNLPKTLNIFLEDVGNKRVNRSTECYNFCYIVPSTYSCFFYQCLQGREVSKFLITTLCTFQLKETEIFVTEIFCGQKRVCVLPSWQYVWVVLSQVSKERFISLKS